MNWNGLWIKKFQVTFTVMERISTFRLSLWVKSTSVIIQMKATEQYFAVMLFIILHRVVLTFESVDKMSSVTTQMKVTEQHSPVVLFILLFKVDLWIKFSSVTTQMKATERYFSVALLVFITLYKKVLAFG